MPEPGDVVTADFVGAMGTKRRPAVVVSSALYYQSRPDLVLAVLTTRLVRPMTPTDYLLQDWAQTGLHQPSTFRAFFSMSSPRAVQGIGHLSDREYFAMSGRFSFRYYQMRVTP